ncbi:PAS domain-containing protein [Sphingomonas sp. 1P06PA]|uniref:PAS domain-containing protein n=1 Tax=Sphingomonas sp. 1P06PA TaxID=554121 RepID=UPI0039A695C5
MRAGGELGRRVEALDWGATPLGPRDQWPTALRVVTQMMLRSQFGMFLIWGPHRIMIYNDAYATLLGKRHPAALGQPFEAVWPEILAETMPLIEGVYAGEPSFFERLPLRVTRNDVPEDTSFTFSYSPIEDDDGSIGGMFCATYETTSIDRSEEELRATRDRLLLAGRATSDAIWDWDLRADHVTWNEALEEAYGHRLDEIGLDGAWWLAQIHPDDRERVDHDIHAVIDGGGTNWTSEYRFRRADGSYADVLDRGYMLRDPEGEPVRMIGAMLDLSGTKKAERALAASNAAVAESEARLQGITDSVDQMIWSTRPDGFHDYYNRRWYEFTGVPYGSTDGEEWNGMFHPDDQERAWATWQHSLATGETYHIEYRLRHHSGLYRWVLGRAQPVRDEAGAIMRWFGTCTDIEEMVAAREELARSRMTLEEQVAERTADLARALDQLRQEAEQREQVEQALRQAQKMEAVGQLTGGIAHDFNNLLTIITGNIDLVGRRLGDDADPRLRRAVDNALKGADRAASLTQRLLAFSRRQPLQPKPTDVNRLISGMADLLTRALGELVALETVAGAGLWTVDVDPHQLESALVNLCVNARDAMPQGGRLTIETSNAMIDDNYAASHAEIGPGRYVLISVTDTGSGMDADTIARAFDPFFTTKEVGKGTGLGLSMVYGFVKQSGGHVKLYSEPGHGTTVRIYLPRLAGDASVIDDGVAAEGERGSRDETILVVEDDAEVRAYTVDTLRDLGYHVIEAADGAEALRLLAREARVHLLLTDVVMPGMTGRELADRARTADPQLRVLFTSGYPRNAIVHGGRLESGVSFLAKPFSYGALATRVRDVLDRRDLRRVLIVDPDPGAAERTAIQIGRLGFTSDVSRNTAEALARLRASNGRFDAALISDHAALGKVEGLVAELHAIRDDLPVLIACDTHGPALRDHYRGHLCVGVIDRPVPDTLLTTALLALSIRCAGGDENDV